MKQLAIARTAAAHDAPFPSGRYAHGVARAPRRKSSGDRLRYYYDARGARATSRFGALGAGRRAGATVAVMDWDSHRYLECFSRSR
jgi:hypothetical protein